jgi:glutamate synthase domain-containing protein 1
MSALPRQGLYDPRYEHDACGIGFVVVLKGRRSHEIVEQGVQVLLNLEHAVHAEINTGDGAGILVQTPPGFLAQKCDELGIKLTPQGQL